MPNYKGHVFGGAFGFGVVIFLCALHQSSCIQLVEWFLCVVAGSLFPDIDTKSKGQKIFYSMLACAMVICVINQQLTILAGIALAAMLPLLSNHRGIFHRLWFVMLLVGLASGALIIAYPAEQQRVLYDAGFFVVGVVSHLYLDVGLKNMIRVP